MGHVEKQSKGRKTKKIRQTKTTNKKSNKQRGQKTELYQKNGTSERVLGQNKI